MEQEEALSELKKQLDLFKEGKTPDSPVWRALRDVFNRYDMSITPFYDQLKGQMMDYHFTQPQTLIDLEHYSYHVAGSVGLMLLPILATDHHEELTQTAISLGVAMQLTNILRDIGEDHRDIGRIYLPKQLMTKTGYTYSELESQTINKAFILLWEILAARSEELYNIVKQDLSQFDQDSRFPVLLSANIYQEILETVRKNRYDCFTTRNKTSLIKKLFLYQKTKKILKKS